MEPDYGEQKKGYIFMVAVYLIWGVLPAFWKLLIKVAPLAIMAHRALWAFVFLAIALAVFYRPKKLFIELVDRKVLGLHLLASFFLAIQWAAYLIAVLSGQLVEMSMGYYIYPLIVALLGWAFLKEKLNRAKTVSLALAGTGVAVTIVSHGRMPILALVLAISFSFYSLIKKRIKINSLNSIFYEILFLMPFALGYIAWAGLGGQGIVRGQGAANGLGVVSSPSLLLLLIGGGVITAITLLLFAAGARRIPIFAIGFLQYISPTIVLLLGVLVYGESFGPAQWASFALIWFGVLVYVRHQVKVIVAGNSLGNSVKN